MLFSFRDRATVASIHKPAVCAKPKEGSTPEPAKAFSSPDATRVVVVRNDEPDLLLWDVATRRLERTVRWPDHTSGSDVIGVSRDLNSVATTEVGRRPYPGARYRRCGEGIPQLWRAAPKM